MLRYRSCWRGAPSTEHQCRTRTGVGSTNQDGQRRCLQTPVWVAWHTQASGDALQTAPLRHKARPANNTETLSEIGLWRLFLKGL